MEKRLAASEVASEIGDLVRVGKGGNTFHRPDGKFLSRHEIEQIIAHADLIRGVETGQSDIDEAQDDDNIPRDVVDELGEEGYPGHSDFPRWIATWPSGGSTVTGSTLHIPDDDPRDPAPLGRRYRVYWPREIGWDYTQTWPGQSKNSRIDEDYTPLDFSKETLRDKWIRSAARRKLGAATLGIASVFRSKKEATVPVGALRSEKEKKRKKLMQGALGVIAVAAVASVAVGYDRNQNSLDNDNDRAIEMATPFGGDTTTGEELFILPDPQSSTPEALTATTVSHSEVATPVPASVSTPATSATPEGLVTPAGAELRPVGVVDPISNRNKVEGTPVAAPVSARSTEAPLATPTTPTPTEEAIVDLTIADDSAGEAPAAIGQDETQLSREERFPSIGPINETDPGRSTSAIHPEGSPTVNEAEARDHEKIVGRNEGFTHVLLKFRPDLEPGEAYLLYKYLEGEYGAEGIFVDKDGEPLEVYPMSDGEFGLSSAGPVRPASDKVLGAIESWQPKPEGSK